jgi:hypothetical protein
MHVNACTAFAHTPHTTPRQPRHTTCHRITSYHTTPRHAALQARFRAYDGLDGSVFLAEEIADATLGDVQYMDVKTEDMVQMAIGFSDEGTHQYSEEANTNSGSGG